MRTDIDFNEQHERRDTLIITGLDLPVVSQNESSKINVKNLLSEITVSVDLNDIPLAHSVGRKLINAPAVDTRESIFKLCRRDLV